MVNYMRVFKNFPDMDVDFQAPYAVIMSLLLFQMMVSFFSYRSLLTSIIVLYSTYITMLYKENIKKYVRNKMNIFNELSITNIILDNSVTPELYQFVDSNILSIDQPYISNYFNIFHFLELIINSILQQKLEKNSIALEINF